MKPPKVVITGGLGFIFSYVTQYFVRKGWEVVVIDNLSAGCHPEIIDGSFVHHNVHMADPHVVELIVKENPDYLIHAAAITDVDYSVVEPQRTMTKNMYGTLHCFEAARRIPNLKKFMYTATDEIYGECEHPMKESDPIMPKNPYSCSKAIGSLVRIAYENTYPELQDKVVETRMCNIFGPRQDTRKIMPQIKRSLAEGYSIPLHQGGGGYREFLYVKNVPPVVELLLEKGVGAYNISLNDGITVKDLIQKVEAVVGEKVKTHSSERPGMDWKYQADASRLRTELGWQPLYSFEEGIKEYFKDTSEPPAKKHTIVVATNDMLLGGAQRLVIDQLRAIDTTVFVPHLIVLMEFPGKETFMSLVPPGVTVHHMRFSGFLDVRAWVRLVRTLKNIRPSIVKTAMFFSNTLFMMLKPLFGYKVITAEHNTLRVKPLWQRLVDRVLLPRSYTIIADSQEVRRFVHESERVPLRCFTVMYNGVDLDAVAVSEKELRPQKENILKECNIPNGAQVLLTVGRLVHQKNIHLMIRAFAELHAARPNVYLVIVAGGKQEKELRELAASLGISDFVRFMGARHDVHRFYAIADGFLITSRHEGFCIAAMEALAFGIPVVSTRVAGISEYLRDAENGFFVEPEEKDIAQKLQVVVDMSRAERAAFAASGKRTAAKYSTVRYMREFVGVLNRIVGGMNYVSE